jgi:SAM-dependent methyltransferase
MVLVKSCILFVTLLLLHQVISFSLSGDLPRTVQPYTESTIQNVPLVEVTTRMKESVKEKSTANIFSTVGYVTHKRSFGNALAFIDLVQDDETHYRPMQALFKKQEYDHTRSRSEFSSILKSIHPGTKLYLEGKASSTNNPGEVVLLLTHIRFLCVSRNPEHTKGILQRINFQHGNSTSQLNEEITGLWIDDICNALHVDSNRLKLVLEGKAEVDDLHKDNEIHTNVHISRIPYSRIAKKITVNLPLDPLYPHKSVQLKNRMQSGMESSSGQRSKNSHVIGLLPAPSSIATLPPVIQRALKDIHNKETKRIDSNSDELQSSIERILELTSFKNSNDAPKYVTVKGWVQNRRRFNGGDASISLFELVDEMASMNGLSKKLDRLKCVLHPVTFKVGDGNVGHELLLPSNVYGHLLAKGSKAAFRGILYTPEERPTLWVTDAKIEQLSWAPNVINYFLDLISNDETRGQYTFQIEEIAGALHLQREEAIDLVAYCKENGVTERQWKATELSRQLQNEKSRIGTLSKDMQSILNALSQLRDEFPLKQTQPSDSLDLQLDPLPIRRKVSPDIRKSSDGSRWRRKKRPQLDWMIDQIQQVCESHPDFGSRPLNILDIGGGRGHLANYLASTLGQEAAQVYVIDIDSSTVRNGQTDAKRRNLDNIQFGIGDASKQASVDSLLSDGSKYDIIVALHACGGLSDVALGHAIANQASFVITPCCFRSNPHLKVLQQKRDEDDFQLVTPSQFLGLTDEDMILLASSAELQGDMEISGKAIHTLCAVRAKAVKKQHSTLANVNIKTFPIQYSTRNFCLVGKVI